ncbi:MAG TPA: SDR family oxidoreductase [Solirubrobacterales bacterium]|nr:SDR family oxidoreductase [Solirubrobacterales bacterium]
MATDTKAIVVTGAASGIGAATVEELARKGARVLAVDLRLPPDPPPELADRVVPYQADVSDPQAVEGMVAAAVEQFGTLDGIFNNAGILGAIAAIPEYPEAVFDEVLRVNVCGVFYGMKFAIPELRRAGGGAIVNTASIAALGGGAEASAYVASKHAVLGLTRSAALEVAKDGIAVNALCPGETDTRMQEDVGVLTPEARAEAAERSSPMGRWAEAEEVARLTAWLLLEAPAFVTGTPLIIDGGTTA